jgi:hypothetical protein
VGVVLRHGPVVARCVALLVAVVVLALPRGTVAQPRPAAVALEWSAPPECPARPWILAEVARLLGRPVDERSVPALRVRGNVARANGSGPYRVLLHTEAADGAGERTLEDPVCLRVAEATAFVIALAIDPGAVAEMQQRRQRAPPPVVPPRPRERLVRFVVGPVVSGDLGTLPQPSLGLGLTLGLVIGRTVRIEAMGTSWLPQDIPAGNGLPGGAHTRVFVLGSLRGCVERGWRWVEIGGCVGFEAGGVDAAGFGISDPVTSQSLWLAMSLGPTFALNVTNWLSFRVWVDVVAALLRPTLTVRAFRGGDLTDLDVYQPSAFVGRAGLAVELRY